MNGPLFESSNLLSLFSTPVWELQLPARLYEPINAAVLAVVDDVRAGDSPPAPGTARQSRPDLHLRPELGDWSIASTKLRSEYCAFSRSPTAASGSPAAGPTSTPRAQPTGCTVTPTVTSAESITCALRPERTASICTTRACRPGLSVPPVTALTAQNTDMVAIQVQAGRLLVFPSWLQHSVSTSAAEGERVSVSFNVIFTD
jgi:hypothetical protein